MKLHLPACGIELEDEEHREALARLLARCDDLDKGLLVRVFGNGEPLTHAERFWSLLEPYPEMEVIIAHVGSSGGYNDRSHALATGLAALIERQPAFANAPIWFDLSGAILVDPEDDISPT